MNEAYDHHRRCQHSIYRMSCEDFDGLYEYARGCCQICRTPERETKRGKLVIDHDPHYASIAVRGLLCDKCNALMDRADRGAYEPLAIRYWLSSWFVRLLIRRRVEQFDTPGSQYCHPSDPR